MLQSVCGSSVNGNIVHKQPVCEITWVISSQTHFKLVIKKYSLNATFKRIARSIEANCMHANLFDKTFKHVSITYCVIKSSLKCR